ncbi:hypothetical protein OROMI_026481 [Orobanche minor]
MSSSSIVCCKRCQAHGSDAAATYRGYPGLWRNWLRPLLSGLGKPMAGRAGPFDLTAPLDATKDRSNDCAVHARTMESLDVKVESRVKAIIHLGPETYLAQANKGRLISEQLNSVKEQSMSFLKDFITKHNIPSDIPDEPEEISSEDDNDKILSPVPPVKKSKKLIID